MSGRKNDAFSGCHPLVNMLFFAIILSSTMLLMHPISLCLSFAGAFAYNIRLNGKKALRFHLLYMLHLLIIAALVNPAFSHQGVTILCYLPSGNPLTFESILYGLAAALMLITVISWFACFNSVMTSDKFVYLFGRLMPALSLILAMALRFVPRFKAQIKIIANAQRCVGRHMLDGNLLHKARCGIRILSIMVTWALENAIETADSMKSRGYGLPGRTAFSIFRFDRRSRRLLIFLLACGGYMVIGAAVGALKFAYYPMIRGSGSSLLSVSLFIAYSLLCAMPTYISILEDAKWKAANKIHTLPYKA